MYKKILAEGNKAERSPKAHGLAARREDMERTRKKSRRGGMAFGGKGFHREWGKKEVPSDGWGLLKKKFGIGGRCIDLGQTKTSLSGPACQAEAL